MLGGMLALALASMWGAAKTIQTKENRIPEEVYARYQAKSGRAQFLLLEKDG